MSIAKPLKKFDSYLGLAQFRYHLFVSMILVLFTALCEKEVGRILFSCCCISLLSFTSHIAPVKNELKQDLRRDITRNKLNNLYGELNSKNKSQDTQVFVYQEVEDSSSIPQVEELSYNEEDSLESSSVGIDISTSYVTERESEVSSDEESVKEKIMVQEELSNFHLLNKKKDPMYHQSLQRAPSNKDREEAMRLLREYQTIQISKIKEARKKLSQQKKSSKRRCSIALSRKSEFKVRKNNTPKLQRIENTPLFNSENLPVVKLSILKPLKPGLPSRAEASQRYFGYPEPNNGIWSMRR